MLEFISILPQIKNYKITSIEHVNELFELQLFKIWKKKHGEFSVNIIPFPNESRTYVWISFSNWSIKIGYFDTK